jgi:hypothetical protein
MLFFYLFQLIKLLIYSAFLQVITFILTKIIYEFICNDLNIILKLKEVITTLFFKFF